MCIFIIALMLLLIFYLSADIHHFKLIESIDSVSVELAQGWELLFVLWPALVAVFLAGVLFVLLALKFIPTQPDKLD